MPLTKEELETLKSTIGTDVTARLETHMKNVDEAAKKVAAEAIANGGVITEASFKTYKEESAAAIEKITQAALKTGTTLQELQIKISEGPGKTNNKSIQQVLVEEKEAIHAIYKQKSGTKDYMLTIDRKGQPMLRPLSDPAFKVTGLEATIADIPTGAVAAISQNLDSATLLRVGSGSPIMSQYRNTPWIFDLCNTTNTAFVDGRPFVMWFDEQPKVGASTAVIEGQTKPLTQYLYQLNSNSYRKEATLIGFTEEFSIDFAQLENDIMGKGRTDVINRVNSAILPRLESAAQVYNTGASFTGGTPITDVNNFDAIAAMAAQVDNATYGGFLANAAVMSTFKKYNMGVSKNNQGSYLNPPAVLSNISFVGNPAMDTDAIMVGDFKQYQILLRGGLIVRIGYNGTDFAENKFSVVMEQYYYDYISAIRKQAIVSGPNFADVKTAIGA